MPIMRAFNRAEGTYDDHCNLQVEVGDYLIQLVKEHYTQCNSIIDLGCGTGLITEKLATQFYYKQFHAIDNANLLLQKSINRLSPHNINVYAADFDHLNLKERFDIVFSNMALHWSIDLATTLKKLMTWLENNGLLAFSIPLPGTLTELGDLYARNPFIDAASIKSVLVASDYELCFYQAKTIHLHFEDTLKALKSIKYIGGNFVRNRKNKSLRGKLFVNNFYLNCLTYVIGFFVVKHR